MAPHIAYRTEKTQTLRRTRLVASGEISSEDRVLAREQVAQVWRTVVEHLGDRQRTVFPMRYVEELENHEIAQATGIEEGAVRAHLSRALQKVRAQQRIIP